MRAWSRFWSERAARLPLRARTTLWVLGIFAVLNLTLSLLVILYHRRTVQSHIDDSLRASTTALTESWADSGSEERVLRRLLDLPASVWGPLEAFAISDRGTLLWSTGEEGDGVNDALIAHLTVMNELAVDDEVSGASSGFLYAYRDLENGVRLAVALPASQFGREVRPVEVALVLMLLVGLAATGIAGWQASGVAHRALTQLQSFAAELSPGHITNVAEDEIDDTGPEVRALRSELQNAMQRIQKGYEAQARFIANVSHELKTPISVISTEAEVLLVGNPSRDDLIEFAQSTSEEMQRLGRMVESFLLLTRVREGKREIRQSRHDANDVLMECVMRCAPMARQYGVELLPTLLNGDTSPNVEGNADLLHTAIDNLIRNAIRFSPRGSRIELKVLSDDGMIVVSIRDHGPGIPEDLLPRLFEQFAQSDDERRRGRGTGLGLQIAQGVAELHRGEIVASNREQGCEFRLFLPPAKPRPRRDETDFTNGST